MTRRTGHPREEGASSGPLHSCPLSVFSGLHYERSGSAGLGNLGRTPKVPSRREARMRSRMATIKCPERKTRLVMLASRVFCFGPVAADGAAEQRRRE